MEQRPKQSEENDALWDLLGQSRPPQASPFFASRVVNVARAESQERFSILRILLRPAFVLAAVTGLVLVTAHFRTSTSTPPVASQDFEALANLDNLIAMDTQVIWDDSSAYLKY